MCSKNLFMKFILFPVRLTLCQTLFFLPVCSLSLKGVGFPNISEFSWWVCTHVWLLSHPLLPHRQSEEHSWNIRVTPGNYSRHKFNRSNIILLRVALRKGEISLNCFRRTVFVHFRDYNIECKLNTTLSQILNKYGVFLCSLTVFSWSKD